MASGSVRVAVSACVLLGACAKVAPPSGGPIDRESPQVVDHHPRADATGVAVDTGVEIRFSEPMSRQTVEAAVFVSPELDYDFNWSGDRLRLSFSEPLRQDRTYVVTVGTGSRDLRRNSLDRSYTFAFATGGELNQGSITGQVYADHEPASGAHVWVYDLERLPPLGSGRPDYRTQTGKDGGFQLSRLSASRYRIMAFDDGDRDRGYDSGEPLGLGAAVLVVGEGETRAGHLAIGSGARPEPTPKRIQALNDRTLLLEFKQAVDAREVTLQVGDLAVRELYSGPGGGRKVYAVTDTQEAGREYRVERLVIRGRELEWTEPVRGRGRPDRARPRVVAPTTRQAVEAGDSLSITFSEAMGAAAPRGFRATPDRAVTLQARWRWATPTTLEFTPVEPLEPGDHDLEISGLGLMDRNGNMLADSLIALRITVLDPSSLPGIVGRVAPADYPVYVVAKHRAGLPTYRVAADSTGRFAIDRVVPGSYDLYGFGDRSGDGEQGFGRLDPYVPAEPYLRGPGVELRDDGEVVEIELATTQAGQP